jgi:DNA mismatch repair protein MutL
MTSEESTQSSETRIQTLDKQTIQRIAAGEVVERPASVVKELIENSLDAGASRVSVAVDRGGKGRIQISDDGHGIPKADLPRAIKEHATSKIRTIEDLEAGVGSLGFRGEALSTIGAVSRLTVRSRPRGGAAGAQLTVEGGTVGTVQPAGCPEGTTVEVEDLFFNTPARKKFLKRDSTEFDHINTVVSQYALANPDVAVSLSHNDRELFGTEGSGSLRSAVLSVYGREVAESMIEIKYSADDSDPVSAISGLISHPETTRSTRAYLATFVNGRYVTASMLRGAVVDGYGGQLAPDRYPFAVLFVEVPPKSVDVNVHPRKTEVRFDAEDDVTGLISEAIERTLVDNGLIRSSAPRGRSAPEETEIAPERTDEEATEESSAQSHSVDDECEPTATPVDNDTQSKTGDEQPETTAGETTTPNSETVAAEPVDPADEDWWTVDSVGGAAQDKSASQPVDSGGSRESIGAGYEPTASESTEETTTESSTKVVDKSVVDSDDTEPVGDSDDTEPVVEQSTTQVDRQYRPTEPTTQQTLTGGETTDRRSYDQLPELRVLGQMYDTYLLGSTDSGLVLIDQHAADERVNYERLQGAIADSPSTQRLAEPVVLELTAREAALFDDHSEQLAEIGFQASRSETRAIEVAAVPAVFSTTLDPELLREALLRFVESTDGATETVTEAVDELLADLACYPSVTGNTSLTEGSVVDLLSALDDCENPYACPHGRPVIIEISREEINDRFERDYPGHSGRRREE